MLSLAPSFGQTLEDARSTLAAYRADLKSFRDEFGGARPLPAVNFFQFGMGLRPKFLYREGTLRDAMTGRVVREWRVREAVILPSEYRVLLATSAGILVDLREDERGFWIESGGKRELVPGSEVPLKLPRFTEHRYRSILRVLHHEILINVLTNGPVPNFYVYKKPWYRDGAMMAMCLERTGNLGQLKPWILSLREPYDRNNAGETEADNLGEALYLVSLVSDRNHPLVGKVLAELPKLEVNEDRGTYIKGRTDFQSLPVYPTKWLKFGLRALGLPDKYSVPALPDAYSSLFWMDYRDHPVLGRQTEDRNKYPYLGWAVDHFQGQKRSPISDRDYPLTWETEASQADYKGHSIVDPAYTRARTAAPHTWHAAEVFLYVLEMR